MAKNIIVISWDIRETMVALIEDGIIAELHIERKGHPNAGSVGDVVLGKVTRVLPGLQAAFIDVGQELAAFLHVEDLIRPDDFETYLAGGRKHAMNENEDGPGANNAQGGHRRLQGSAQPATAGELEASLPVDRPRASPMCRPKPKRWPKRRTRPVVRLPRRTASPFRACRRRGSTSPRATSCVGATLSPASCRSQSTPPDAGAAGPLVTRCLFAGRRRGRRRR